MTKPSCTKGRSPLNQGGAGTLTPLSGGQGEGSKQAAGSLDKRLAIPGLSFLPLQSEMLTCTSSGALSALAAVNTVNFCSFSCHHRPPLPCAMPELALSSDLSWGCWMLRYIPRKPRPTSGCTSRLEMVRELRQCYIVGFKNTHFKSLGLLSQRSGTFSRC